MPTSGPFPRTVRRAAVAALLVTAVARCGGEPTDPNPQPGSASYTPIAVGDTVSATLRDTVDGAGFTFRVSAAGQMALFAIADAPLTLTVADSALEQPPSPPFPIALVHPEGNAGEGVLERRTERFAVEPGHTYVVRAYHYVDSRVTTQFRMFLYRIDPSPEHRPAAFAAGDTVAGERIENSADMDEFLLALSTGSELIAYFQSDDSLASGAVGLTVLRPDGSALASVAGDTGVSDIEGRATGRFVIPADGVYRFLVQGGIGYPSAMPTVGGFRFQVLPINRAPETGPSTIALGDTTTSAIEHQGDVDEYTITGAPGQEFNSFFQSLGGALVAGMEGATPLDEGPFGMESSGQDTSLYAVSSRTVALPASGSATIRVQGANDQYELARGEYRFFLYPIDRAPESGPATLTLGDSVDGSLELPGDIDEFKLTVPSSGLANLLLESPTGGGLLLLTRLDVTGQVTLGDQLLFPGTPGTPIATGTGPFQLSQSVYTLRVQSGSDPAAFRGPYRIATYRIHPEPETAAATMTYEVPVTDAIAPVGDYDEFTFSGQKGDVIGPSLQRSGGTSEFPLGARLTRTNPVADLASATWQTAADPEPIGRFILPADGTFQISVGGDGTRLGTTGGYTLALHRLDTGPEHVPAAIAPGVTLTAEAIDHPGDVDEFVLSAAAGAELQVTFLGIPSTMLKLEVDAPVSYDSLKGTDSFGFLQATGRFLMPAGGQARIRVYNPGNYGANGPYTVRVIAVQRTPESVPAAIGRGVKIAGESIDYAGDIDEFTFSGTAGETITAFLQTPQGFLGLSPAILEVIEPGTGDVLGSAQSWNPSPGPHGASTGAIVLGASGTYRLRVRGMDDREGTGAIEVFVQ
jgi:hypothetical protein